MHGWQANQREHLRYGSEQGLCPKMKNHPLCGWMIIVLYALEYIKYLQNNEIFILFKSVNLSVNSFNRAKYNVYDV